MSDEVITTLYPSPTRRFLGIGMLRLLGGLLIYTGLAHPPDVLGWQAFLLGMGALSLWVSERMRHATSRGVELTTSGLRGSDGEMIAPIDEIHSVDRSMFVFKPSNGFVVRLKRSSSARIPRTTAAPTGMLKNPPKPSPSVLVVVGGVTGCWLTR